MTLKQKIAKIYARRQKAHDELLACDIEIDKLFVLLAAKLEKMK